MAPGPELMGIVPEPRGSYRRRDRAARVTPSYLHRPHFGVTIDFSGHVGSSTPTELQRAEAAVRNHRSRSAPGLHRGNNQPSGVREAPEATRSLTA